jgi:hypothetical protein
MEIPNFIIITDTQHNLSKISSVIEGIGTGDCQE